MSSRAVVVIGPESALAPLMARQAAEGHAATAFADTRVLDALATIVDSKPARVVLEETFAVTSRGASLINRLKADPALRGVTITIPFGRSDVVAASETAGAELDAQGTRRLPRVAIHDAVDMTIDGNAVTLVDLSTRGAQVSASAILRPNQRVRVAIADTVATLRMSGTIAWANFEIPPGRGPVYKAGIEFMGADAEGLRAFCQRHGAA